MGYRKISQSALTSNIQTLMVQGPGHQHKPQPLTTQTKPTTSSLVAIRHPGRRTQLLYRNAFLNRADGWLPVHGTTTQGPAFVRRQGSVRRHGEPKLPPKGRSRC